MTLLNSLGSTLFIARTRGRDYSGVTMLRLFACLAAALALFFSPVAMSGGFGVAAAHSPSGLASMPADHCTGEEAPSDDQQPDMTGSCVSSCAAFAPDGLLVTPEAHAGRSPLAMSRHQLLVGIHPEGETPPPRITPEI